MSQLPPPLPETPPSQPPQGPNPIRLVRTLIILTVFNMALFGLLYLFFKLVNWLI